MRIRIAFAVAALAVPALAGVASASHEVKSENANQQACFGQARAWYSSQGINGEVISERKGTNAENNAQFRANCQAQ